MKQTNKLITTNNIDMLSYKLIRYNKHSMVDMIAIAYSRVGKWLKQPITRTQEHFIFIALLFVFVWVIVGGVLI